MAIPTPTLRNLAGAALLAAVAAVPAGADDFAARRAAMVETIESYGDVAARALGPQGFDRRVLDAMRAVPRHLFVPEDMRRLAYRDRALPIGQDQTISQPFVVALMTDLARPRPGDTVLEIGTGSGYQAAVLAKLARKVYTIEIVKPLAEAAKTRLKKLGYANVEVRAGDGYHGWPEAGPFDSIVVTAGADHIPPKLVEQLRRGGRMVIPLGGGLADEELTVVEKDGDGKVTAKKLLPVRFVPFTREQ